MKRLVELVLAVAIPLLYVSFVITDHMGAWAKLRGLDLVENVATRLETSYAKNVDRQIGPDEVAWKPLIQLIYKYSRADFPKERPPKLVARWVAVATARVELGRGEIAEWTAPTTPLVVAYWEGPAADVPAHSRLEDARFAGSIGDLRTWIARSKDDFSFLVKDIFLSTMAMVFGFLLWRMNRQARSNS